MANFIVTTLNDELDAADTNSATFDPNDLSLREALALALANGAGTSDTITFNAGLAGGTLLLTNGVLAVSSNVSIDGDLNKDGLADITIDGNHATSLLSIAAGITAEATGLRLTHGAASGTGYAAAAHGSLGSNGANGSDGGSASGPGAQIAGNGGAGGLGGLGGVGQPGQTGFQAGAIFNRGTLTLRGVELDGNAATGGAGGTGGIGGIGGTGGRGGLGGSASTSSSGPQGLAMGGDSGDGGNGGNGGGGGIGGDGGSASGAIVNLGTLTLIDVGFTSNSANAGTGGAGGKGGTGGTGGPGPVGGNAIANQPFNSSFGGDGGNGGNGGNGGSGGNGGDSGNGAGAILNLGDLTATGTVASAGNAGLTGVGGIDGDGGVGGGIGAGGRGAVMFNADELRANINKDLGFTESDRIEQASRMGWLCDQVIKTGGFAIADFICPTPDTRAAYLVGGDAFIVWLNRIKSAHRAIP